MRINRNVSVPPPPPPPPAPSAEVLALRHNWKWAYLSHFLFTYNPVLHLEDIPLSDLENDLGAGTSNALPIVMQRLLMCLTPHDKKMILEDWQQQLRKQSLKRDPENHLLGDDDEPVDFDSLIMTDKLNIFHSLCEWQFHNSVSLRHRMRNDDEDAHWRIEPIAYDINGNAYWLLGGNRLWKQYAPSRKRLPPSKKRKQPSTATSNGRKSTKRKQASAPKSKAVPVHSPPKPARKLPKPVRETRSHTAGLTRPRSRPLGTRVSSRLRGKDSEDEWQSIPEEWLKGEDDRDSQQRTDIEESSQGRGFRRSKRKSKEADMKAAEAALDDVSDLTSLSELSDIPEVEDEGGGEEEEEEEEDYNEIEKMKEEEEEEEEEEESTPPRELDFSAPDKEAWETVCVTVEEWEEFPKQFENSRYKIEKDFYKLLANDLVPVIVDVLKEDMRKKIVQEPVIVERKRSSRLAVKESIKEAERDAARKRAEEEKEMERHRRWEARARKEEEDRQKRENMRSARLREKAKLERGESAEIDIVGGMESKLVTNGVEVGSQAASAKPNKSGTQTPKEDEPWELDCEICHRHGINLDGDQQLLLCEHCNKWQHIRCHDQADLIAGRRQRNWDKEEFVCSTCRAKDRIAVQPQKPQSYPQNWPIASYNGIPAVVPINGLATPKDPCLTPQQRALKPVVSHSNGRPIYPAPQTQNRDANHYPTAQYQYRRQPPTAASSQAAYTSTAAPSPAPSQGRASLPYSTAPNMYMSTYVGGVQRPPQTATPNQSPPQQSHYRTANIAAHAPQSGAWSQQQLSYQTWSTNAAATSGTQPYGGAPMANGYRPHAHVETAVPLSTGASASASAGYYRPPLQSHVLQAQQQEYHSRGAGS